MLTADEIDALTFPITRLYEDFEDTIINDISRRIGSLDYAKPTAALQVQRLAESGMLYDDILQKVSDLTGKSETELRKMFQAAGVKTTKFDDEIYRAAGLKPLPLNLSPAMQETLIAGLRKTGGVFKNLTMTTALAGQEAYIKATDMCYMQISTGTLGYAEAIKRQVKQLAADGITHVQFGKITNHLDVAVRRAAITGVSQTAAQVQMTRMEQMGCDLVQVSAHAGARPTHQLWQGKVYGRLGEEYGGKYPDLVEATGYGTGPGLMGWNCRHSIYPYYHGISPDHYAQKELDEYADKKVKYNGEEMSFYEGTQVQRGIEREIRHWKRQANALASAKVDNGFEVMKLQQAQAKMRSFIKQTGIVRQRNREGFAVQRFYDPKTKKPIAPTKLPPKTPAGAPPPPENFPGPAPAPKPAPVELKPKTLLPPSKVDAVVEAKATQSMKDLARTVDTTKLSRGEWKDQISQSLLSELQQIDPKWKYDQVNELIHQWAITSNDESKLALRMQKRASEKFKTAMSPWQQAKYNKEMGFAEAYADKFTDKMLDDFLQAMYNQTQEYFKSRGITSVKMYRGVQLRPPEWNKPIDDAILNKLKDVMDNQKGLINIDANSMSSWAFNKSIADGFSTMNNGFVLEAVVPVEKIVGTCFTGFGCLNEYEAVVLGGLDDWARVANFWIKGISY